YSSYQAASFELVINQQQFPIRNVAKDTEKPESLFGTKLLNLCYDNSFGINLNRSRLSVCLVIEDRACALCVV
ncbi:MAG: hypothetical protein ACKPGT_32235, partial [Microcystis sp.]